MKTAIETLTLVEQDQLVILNGLPQHFDLEGYDQPDDLWALQWTGSDGHIEFDQQHSPGKPNEAISQLPDWTGPIIAEHIRLTEEQQEEADKQAAGAVFITNGQARRDRIQRQSIAARKSEQQQINQFVKEQMP